MIEDTPDSDLGDTAFVHPLQDCVRTMLDQRGYLYQFLGENDFFMIVRGSAGSHPVFLLVDEVREVVRIVASYGPNVPPDRRQAVAELASRINSRLMLGSFELDFNDGEIRYRIGIDIEGGLFSEVVADNMLGCTLCMLDQYADAFMHVAFSDLAPEAAVACVE